MQPKSSPTAALTSFFWHARLLADPAWPLRAAKALGVTPEVPPQYLRAAF